MLVLTRVVMAFFAYLLACIVASAVLTMAALSPAWDDLASLGVPSGAIWIVIGGGAIIIAAMAVLPAALLIVLAEGFAWRSVLLYGVVGGVMALALWYGVDFAGYAGNSGLPVTHEPEVFAGAGIAGGLVYWLFAGRNAGLWKR